MSIIDIIDINKITIQQYTDLDNETKDTVFIDDKPRVDISIEPFIKALVIYIQDLQIRISKLENK